MKHIKQIFLIILVSTLFTGCFVGKVVSAPFKVVGAVTPSVVGDAISGTGDVVDMAIPF